MEPQFQGRHSNRWPSISVQPHPGSPERVRVGTELIETGVAVSAGAECHQARSSLGVERAGFAGEAITGARELGELGPFINRAAGRGSGNHRGEIRQDQDSSSRDLAFGQSGQHRQGLVAALGNNA